VEGFLSSKTHALLSRLYKEDGSRTPIGVAK